MGQGINAGVNGLNIYNGLRQGGFMGDASAAVNAGAMYNNLYGTNNGAGIPGVGPLGNALGIYSGIKQGGIAGYGGAAINAAELAQSLGAGIGGTAGAAIPVVGAALATYNFAKNWQSGATGSDALNGAETGASIGTMIEPGIGTVVGAVIGGAAGALSSAFGQGRADPETGTWNGFVAATGGDKATQAGVTQALQGSNPQENFRLLAGMMDYKGSNKAPLEQVFGQQGGGKVLTGMTDQVDAAIKSGKISANATPQQMYSQVVQPWLNSQGATIGSETGGYQIQGVLTDLLGEWQSGQLTSKTALDSGGDTDTSLEAYAGGAPTAAPTRTTRKV